MEWNENIEKKTSLYPYSNKEAHRLGSWDVMEWDKSFQANVLCKQALEALATEAKSTNNLAPDCLKPLIEEYGHERVQWVLANSIKMHKQREDISPTAVAWAKAEYQPVDKNMGLDYRLKYAAAIDPPMLDKLAVTMQAEYAALNLWDISHCNPTNGLDYTDKVMVVSTRRLVNECKAPDFQLILCQHGFGCRPEASGRKVFGQFLIDGEKCQFERSDFIGELRQEHWPDWVKQKMEQGEQTQADAPQMGGLEMQ